MNALNPPISVLVKLGSIAVHAEELLSPGGHRFDIAAIKGLLRDEEVIEWRKEMNDLAMLPVKRL